MLMQAPLPVPLSLCLHPGYFKFKTMLEGTLECGKRKPGDLFTKRVSYHLQRPFAKVPLGDQSLLVGDVESTLGQCPNDGIVAQQGLGSVTLQDEAAGPAVEVCRQQEARHGRLQVLLLILVRVEGVLQICRDAVCMAEGRRRYSRFGSEVLRLQNI